MLVANGIKMVVLAMIILYLSVPPVQEKEAKEESEY